MQPGGSSRRSLVQLAALAGLTLAAAGCGELRLESAAPRTATPTVPAVADETVLRAALARAEHLARLAAEVPGQVAVAQRHTRQVTACRAVLTAWGLATATASAQGSGSTPTPSGPSPSTTAAAPTAAELAAAEARRDTPSWGQLAAAQSADLLHSLAAHDAATAVLLGGTVDWPASRIGVDYARAQLPGHRAAWYAAQVAAARTSSPVREELAELIQQLRRRTAVLAQAVGPTASPAPLAYTLPLPVGSEAEARQLVATVLSALVASGLAGLPPSGATTGATTGATGEVTVGAVRLLAELVVLGTRWGVTTPALPGLVEST